MMKNYLGISMYLVAPLLQRPHIMENSLYECVLTATCLWPVNELSRKLEKCILYCAP